MTSEAIVIGVNHYEFLQPLKYAQQDALALKEFLETEAKFDRVYYFAEDAPMVNGMSMRPTRNNIRRVMRGTFAEPFMGDGDNFWFFFSGHGMRSGERDFLMPIDGDPEDVVESGISTAQVSEWLRGCGADNVVMVLDACRSGGTKDGKGIGDETRESCRQTGVISLFSCSPNQFSYELEAHQQGAFTKVLLEGLGVQGGCATVARLDEYLKRRVPEIVRDCLGDRYSQMPYSIAEPIHKAHHILLPNLPYSEDDRSIFDENVKTLKMDALRAQISGDLQLAVQCWLQINIARQGRDREAREAIIELTPRVSQSAAPNPIVKSTTIVDSYPQKSVVVDSKRQRRNIDYSYLESMLKLRQWDLADEETWKLILKMSYRDKEGWISVTDINNIHCANLHQLDNLWKTASNGKFGLTIQVSCYLEYGSLDGSSFNMGIWEDFGDAVNWRRNNDWLEVLHVNSLSQSSIGQLPAVNVWLNLRNTPTVAGKIMHALLLRTMECNV